MVTTRRFAGGGAIATLGLAAAWTLPCAPGLARVWRPWPCDCSGIWAAGAGGAADADADAVDAAAVASTFCSPDVLDQRAPIVCETRGETRRLRCPLHTLS